VVIDKRLGGVKSLESCRDPCSHSRYVETTVSVLTMPNGNPQIRVQACLDGGDW
jgi:hypothetical protein